jgi:uncharacterized protein (TIGR02246 family)
MHFYRLALVAPILACSGGGSPRPPVAREGMQAEIVAMLDRSARAWNRGDLDAFVGDYLDSSRTTFVGRRGLVHGLAAIRAAYAPRFAPGALRDSLSFEGVEVDSLAPGVAHVVAFYVLARGDSTVARGPTSLVMVRRGGRWRIVHDHSS